MLMTNESQAALVLRDADDHYYLLDQATMEGARVPAERKAEIDRLLADDVAGFRGVITSPTDLQAKTGIIANGMEILGIAWGGPTLVRPG
jgi:hypothetical protein